MEKQKNKVIGWSEALDIPFEEICKNYAITWTAHFKQNKVFVGRFRLVEKPVDPFGKDCLLMAMEPAVMVMALAKRDFELGDYYLDQDSYKNVVRFLMESVNKFEHNLNKHNNENE